MRVHGVKIRTQLSSEEQILVTMVVSAPARVMEPVSWSAHAHHHWRWSHVVVSSKYNKHEQGEGGRWCGRVALFINRFWGLKIKLGWENIRKSFEGKCPLILVKIGQILLLTIKLDNGANIGLMWNFSGNASNCFVSTITDDAGSNISTEILNNFTAIKYSANTEFAYLQILHKFFSVPSVQSSITSD